MSSILRMHDETAISLAKLFFYEALCSQVCQDNGMRTASEYIEDIYRSFPDYKTFNEKAGVLIDVRDGSIFVDNVEFGPPQGIL